MVRPFGKRRVQAQAEYLQGVAIMLEIAANNLEKERATGQPSDIMGNDTLEVLRDVAVGLHNAGQGWVKEVSG